uniref:Uncharacterized protein n=1 Tax=uncultured marine virus TaxID=186617 RepID=A0A0F7L3T0_9VIRU|nr:hypothetical protein [uncultured marine virus]
MAEGQLAPHPQACDGRGGARHLCHVVDRPVDVTDRLLSLAVVVAVIVAIAVKLPLLLAWSATLI